MGRESCSIRRNFDREGMCVLGAIIITRDMAPASPVRIEHLRLALADHADRVIIFGGAGGADAPEHVPLPPAVSELGAIATVLSHAGDDHAIVAAADLRHPSSELLRYMAHVRGSFEAVVPLGPDDLPQPLLALYHPRCAGRARGLLSAGERDLSALLQIATVRRITADEVAKFGDPAQLLARGA